MRRALLFLPSLVLGVLAAGLLLLWPAVPVPRWPWPQGLLLGLATGAALLAVAWWLERRVPSFRWASRLLERTLRRLQLPASWIVALALATAVSEEAFFRGALLGLIHPPALALPLQAALFGALHPVPRRGWAYPAFAVAAGLAFGAVTLLSGSLLPSMVAHALINLQGLLEVRRTPPGPPAGPGTTRP